MSIGPQGENLVFLISQPRAGSTLLQRVLGSHPAIHTTSEPWLMLHPLYALRQEGYQAEYAAQWALHGLRSFLATLAGKEDDYYHSIRAMCSYLYLRALDESGKRYFVDKTPRYYFVIPELLRVFPEAHYIILLRNPLAVLSSILNTWVAGDWLKLHNFKADLVRAPRLLVTGLDHVGERGIAVHYEQLVENPESELRRIGDALSLDIVPEMVEYGRGRLPRWQYGDQEVLYQHPRPVPDMAEKWISGLDNPQTWRLQRDYLELLGEDMIQQMGYSFADLGSILARYQPTRAVRWLALSLDFLLDKPPQDRSIYMRSIMRLGGSVRRRGVRVTTLEICRRTLDALTNFH